MKDSIKVLLKKKHAIVTKVLNEWDPMDLLAMGAPKEEYGIEANRIVAALNTLNTVDELGSKIKEVFDHYYSTDLDLITCIQVASLIWDELYRE
jgi:hypothetical protein